MQISKIKVVAKKYGWEEILPRKNPAMVSFHRGNERINVFHTTGTVATCLEHPIKGKTQLFRRNIDTVAKLEQIFDRPRVHTGSGYYEKSLMKAGEDIKAGDLVFFKDLNASSGNRDLDLKEESLFITIFIAFVVALITTFILLSLLK